MDKNEQAVREEVMNNMINKIKEFAADEKCSAVWLVATIDSSEETGIEGSFSIDFNATMDELQAAQILNRLSVQVGMHAMLNAGLIEEEENDSSINVHTHNTPQ